jgi:predicted component of type VI protein secretion system
MGLQQVERRLERLVEGVFSKAFRGGLQPVELARRLVREMEAGRTVSTRGTVAPNHAVVTLSEADAERFESFADALVLELEDAMREHARDRHYRIIGPVKVDLFQDPDFSKSQHSVVVEVRQGPGGMPAAALVLGDGSRVAIGEDPVAIGRSPESTVKLTDSTVSRNHAQIVRDGDAWILRDVGSSNGTKVNGTAIAEHILEDGDEIKIGAVTLRFEMS